ncbi:hypothetical protein FHS39_003558 [Streptomyces olivoverticillatus]|uniref:Uncharacterized protein n=1 Tax=Streptomyces olivoverticillatus TaxID=66427 RepID=A0A7W7PN54_9ACTN|nr:hypothetical protein [Streptomyces olivoverticillatus]
MVPGGVRRAGGRRAARRFRLLVGRAGRLLAGRAPRRTARAARSRSLARRAFGRAAGTTGRGRAFRRAARRTSRSRTLRLARRTLAHAACAAGRSRALRGGAGWAGRAGRAGGSRGELALEGAPFVGVRDARGEHLAALRAALRRFARLLRARPRLGHPGRQDEVLAQGVALEALRQQERDQVRVALEVHAEHLVGLALVPRRAREDAHGTRQRRRLVRHRRAQEQTADRARPGQRRDVRAHPKARARFVHRAKPVEERAAQPVTGGPQRGQPLGRGDVDGQQPVRLLGGRILAEEFLGARGQPHHAVSPGVGGAATRPLRSAAADGRV